MENNSELKPEEDTCGCGCSCGCSDPSAETSSGKAFRKYIPGVLSAFLLMTGIVVDHWGSSFFFTDPVRWLWYLAAYLPVGWPVLKEAVEEIRKNDFFNEFTLMGIATLGAFAIGQYPEAVGVMLFYAVGEHFQDAAVDKAKRNIKVLLDIRPDSATVIREGKHLQVAPETVAVGERILVKAGEKVPLDGILLSPKSSFNTAALTGESKPRTVRRQEKVLAGMVNLDHVVEIEVKEIYANSSLAKILELVQHATSRKAKTELLIRRFAKIYTPIVFFLALGIALLPFFLVEDYAFKTWLYRALVFLVISCPCALVISIPLGYFGGIGAASKHGVLFKGANYLDRMTQLNTVVMDKTGTLTKGVFKVQEIVSATYDKEELIGFVAALENHSNHPIAKAITSYPQENKRIYDVEEVKEISGFGLKGKVDGKQLLVGNEKLMQKEGVDYDTSIRSIVDSIVLIAIDRHYAGYITIADEEKEDAADAIRELRKLGIRQIMVLSGDKQSITGKLATRLGIDQAHGDLLPEEKVAYLEELKTVPRNVVAFVGDGINDSPSLAISDIGIAMGGVGSDAAIEVADVIIQTDQPSKIATAVRIAKATRRIVLQNICLAFTIKALVLLLGAMGYATMWEAVFADVGVALLAILNAVRILHKKF
ncbi:heavy metal translocating P-type ATPase [Parabacteroides sp. Marseille-P3160]|uniref:heavy metal translocating P-type ATPase n=1 Tax=Parabacteroides sp. Marseille-P3160 TaxID=1917887 RepID=UPI0009BC2F84|nr:heavy metal translocating P-type ATPase [Parabacteroides sp. Marseille-P3160]